MGLRNMARLADPEQHEDKSLTYNRAVMTWAGEVCGGGLATLIGSLGYFGVKASEHAAEFSDNYYVAAGTVAVAGVAAIAHGMGRLQEMARSDLIDPVSNLVDRSQFFHAGGGGGGGN